MAQNPTRIETTTKTVIKQTEAFLLASTRIWDSAHELVPIDGANAGKHKDGNDVDTYADLPFREDASGTGVTQEYVDNEILAVNQGWNDGDSLLFNDYTAKLALKADAVPTYVAYIEQSGTDAPVATVLKNTLGGTVVWTYSTVGFYIGTLTGAFPAGRTAIWFAPSTGPAQTGWVANTNNVNSVQISQWDGGTPADALGEVSILMIEVYPAP